MFEPGLDLHEWETRWQELQDWAAEAPGEALPEIVRFVGHILAERGVRLDEPVTAEGYDGDIVKDFLAAQEIGDAAEAGRAEPDDVAVGLDDLREIYDYFASDRAFP